MADDWSQIYENAGRANNVDPALLRALVQTESSGNPNAVSSAGAVGPAQLLPATAQALGVTDSKDPQQAIFGAAKLLDENLKTYGTLDDALRAYHGGTDKKNWGPKTEAYRGKVLAAYSGAPAPVGTSDDELLAGLPSADAKTATDDELLAGIPVAVGTSSTASAQSGPSATIGQIQPGIPSMAALPLLAMHPELLRSTVVGGLQGLATLGHTVINQTARGSNAAENALAQASQMNPFAAPGAAIMHYANQAGGAITNALGISPQENVAEVGKYQQQYGKNPLATLGLIAGQTAITAPIIAAGGAAALPAIAEASPIAASVLGMAGNTVRAVPYAGPLIANALAGSAQGAGTAAMTTAANPDAPALQQIETGAEIGGVLGTAAPILQKTAKGAYNLLTGSNAVAPATAALADLAINKYGIPLRGSQITDSPLIRRTDTVLGNVPFSGMKGSNNEIAAGFNRAVGNTIGATSDTLTPDVVLAAKKAIGAKFDQAAAAASNIADVNLGRDLVQMKQDIPASMTDTEAKPLLNSIDQIFGFIAKKNGVLSGEDYQTLTKNGSPLDKLTDNDNSTIARTAQEIKSALNDALSRNSPVEMQQMLAQAKAQYKNYITLKPLLAKAPEGQISPALLLNRVQQVYGNMDTGGGGNLGDLARIGQRFLKPSSSSGTAENIGIGGLLAESGAALVNPHAALPALGATIGAMAAGRGASAALRSNWYRNMLLNQPQTPAAQSLTNMLFSNAGVPAAVATQQSNPLFFPGLANAH